MPNLETPDEVQPNVIEVENKENVDPQQFSVAFGEKINDHNSDNPDKAITWIPWHLLSKEAILEIYQEIRNGLEQQFEQAFQRCKESKIHEYATPIAGSLGAMAIGYWDTKRFACVVLGGLVVGFVIWAEANCSCRQQSWYIKKIKSIIDECITKEQKKMAKFVLNTVGSATFAWAASSAIRWSYWGLGKFFAGGAYMIHPMLGLGLEGVFTVTNGLLLVTHLAPLAAVGAVWEQSLPYHKRYNKAYLDKLKLRSSVQIQCRYRGWKARQRIKKKL